MVPCDSWRYLREDPLRHGAGAVGCRLPEYHLPVEDEIPHDDACLREGLHHDRRDGACPECVDGDGGECQVEQEEQRIQDGAL